MSSERRVDHGDHVEVWEGEPTWDNPLVWSSYRVEWKPGTQPYVIENNERTLRERAAAALTGNADFLALDPPTNAQAVAQIRALTRQVNGVIRLLVLDRLDSIDDA